MSLTLNESLHILAILDDAPTVEMMERALAETRDMLAVCGDLGEGLARAANEVPDVVLIDVSMGQNAGLAVVHHVRAVAPTTAVFALTRLDSLELGSQAVALGGSGVLMMPLSGDELLTVVSDVRTRRAEQRMRVELEQREQLSRRSVALVSRVADMGMVKTRKEAAEFLATLLVEAGADRVLVYLVASQGSRQLMRSAGHDLPPEAPAFCEEMELLRYASAENLGVLRLDNQEEHSGLVLTRGLTPRTRGEPTIAELIAAQAVTVFALIREREHSQRGAMKDPSSSAYTFAYFVDVTGREIDMARRHGRRFALATITLDPNDPVNEDAVERVLSAVRDTDVLARVDETELYLLLPETGGVGAHTSRRRVLGALSSLGDQRKPNGGTGQDVAMGVAIFPHDGTDLSRLLRVAKHRADASQHSVVRRVRLRRFPLSEVLDTLLWSLGSAGAAGFETPRVIELPVLDMAAVVQAVTVDAVRGGSARIVATHRTGVSMATTVRSVLNREDADIRFDAVDVHSSRHAGDLEVLVVIAEQGVYVLLGRVEGDLVRAVHSADPLLADLVLERLGDAAGVRLVD